MDLRLHHPSPSIKEWRVLARVAAFQLGQAGFYIFEVRVTRDMVPWPGSTYVHMGRPVMGSSWLYVGCFLFFGRNIMKALTKLQNSCQVQVQKLCPVP